MTADHLMLLPDQVAEIEQALNACSFPKKTFTNVLVMGMGGSTLGAHIVKSICFNTLTVPFDWKNGYTIPDYVHQKTLVILSSYSGNTEEVREAAKQAHARKLHAVVLTSGGELSDDAKKYHIPAVIFNTRANPSKQPRNGVVYNMAGIMGILLKCRLLQSETKKSPDIASECKKISTALKEAYTKHQGNHLAKEIADHSHGHSLVLLGAEHLEGNLHVFQNQVHESAKQLAMYDTLPEANHHLLEGLKNPKGIAKSLAVLIFQSNLYHKRNQLRVKITADILKKQGAHVKVIELSQGTILNQAMELLVISSQSASRLANLNYEDPNNIPFVNELKKQLGSAK